MLHLVLGLLPFAAAAAVSPMMLTEQTVLLAGPGGRRTARWYAAGTAVVASLLVVVVLTIGRSLALPRTPQLNAGLDLVVGVLLLALAAVAEWWRRSRPRRPARTPRGRMTASRAFVFGMFSMATNATSLALLVPATKEIAASRLDVGWWALPALLLVTAACLPAWGPLALHAVAPRATRRVLGGIQRGVDRYGARLTVLLLAGAGVLLVVRGLVRLASG